MFHTLDQQPTKNLHFVFKKEVPEKPTNIIFSTVLAPHTVQNFHELNMLMRNSQNKVSEKEELTAEEKIERVIKEFESLKVKNN